MSATKNPGAPQSRRWRDAAAILAAALIAAVGSLLLAYGVWLCVSGESSDSAMLREKAKKHLSEAHAHNNTALAKRLQEVRVVFQRGRSGTAAFADDALSWGGKWALVKGTLGIGEGDAHAAFLAEAFAKHVFTADDLKAALENAIQGYLSDLDTIENQLLVRLRFDLADSELGRGMIPSLASDQAFREEYRRLAGGLMPTLYGAAGVDIGSLAAGIVVMDVATPIVIRIIGVVAAELGLEAGILGAGAASGLTTLGVGLVVGIIADQAIAWGLKQSGYDPAAEIAAKVRATLDRVEALLIDGSADKVGLHQELKKIGTLRAMCQKTVVNQLLEGVKP